jgi:hypothetical protein
MLAIASFIIHYVGWQAGKPKGLDQSFYEWRVTLPERVPVGIASYLSGSAVLQAQLPEG